MKKYFYLLITLTLFQNANAKMNSKKVRINNPINTCHSSYTSFSSAIHHINKIESNFEFPTLGTAETKYSGSRDIEARFVPGIQKYRLEDLTRGDGIKTQKFNFINGDFVFSWLQDNDNLWTSSEYNNEDQDQVLLDAHWAMQMTYDYFKNKHNRNSYDGNGANINVVTQFSNRPGFITNLNNYAFWDSQYNVFMLGHGDNINYSSFVSLDNVSNVFALRMLDFDFNDDYNIETAAIRYGLPDIWSACVENYAAPEKNHWLIGEDITINTYALKNLSNPKDLQQADTYLGEFWNSGSIDQLSGVISHWFYLLVEGSGDTDEINDNGDVFHVDGVGIEKAAQIVYKVQKDYLSLVHNLKDFREYVMKSVLENDSFGCNSPEHISVQNAFFAVGIGEEYSYDNSVNPNFSFVATYCDNSEILLSVSADNYLTSSNHLWSIKEVSLQGSISDEDIINNNVVPNQQGTSVATFNNINPNKHYFIKHVIWQNNMLCDIQEKRIPIQMPQVNTSLYQIQNEDGIDKDTFCYGENIFLSGSISTYNIEIYSRVNIGNIPYTLDTTMEGTLNGTQEGINLSSLLSQPQNYFLPNYEYKLKISVSDSSSCTAISPPMIRTFNVVCCGETLADFDLISSSITNSGYKISASNYDLNDNLDFVHEWYVLSSNNGTEGPYTVETKIIGSSFEFLNAQLNTFYFVVHKVITPCGTVCYGVRYCEGCFFPGPECEFCGPVDCSEIPVSNLDFDCETQTISWNELFGLDEYIVEVTWADPSCYKFEDQPSTIQYTTTANSFVVPPHPQIGDGFSYRVGFDWGDGDITWSDLQCATCRRRSKVLRLSDINEKSDLSVSVYPNPSDGDITIDLFSETEVGVKLEVYQFNGRLIKVIDELNINAKKLSYALRDELRLRPGIYFLVVTSDNGDNITKKLIVK